MKTSSQAVSTTIEEVGEGIISPTSESRGLKQVHPKSVPSISTPSPQPFPLLGFYEESHTARMYETDDGVFAARWNRKAHVYDTEKYLETFLQDKLSKHELDSIVRSLLPQCNTLPGKILDNPACVSISLLFSAAIATVVLHFCRVLEQKTVTAVLLICCIVVILGLLCCKVKQANDFLIKWNKELQEKINQANLSLRSTKDVSVAKSAFGYFLVFQFHSEMLPEPAHSSFCFQVGKVHTPQEQAEEAGSASVNDSWRCEGGKPETADLPLHRCNSETEHLSHEPVSVQAEDRNPRQEP